MPSPLDPPNWDAYYLPILSSGLTLPDGNFLLPVCTNKERLTALLTALDEFQPEIGLSDPRRKNLLHMIDVLEALNHINDCVECGDPEMPDEMSCCKTYLNTTRALEWQPNDPYRTPNLEPDGYAHPPWVVSDGTGADGLIGLQAGDVFTDVGRILGGTPFGSFDLPLIFLSGFPRFKFHFTGAGEIELHLLTVPFGGLALITVDGDPLSSIIVDLSSLSLSEIDSYLAILNTILGGSIQGGLFAERVIELQIEGDGEHYIDVTMLPKIIPPDLGWGGGLRKIVLCGAELVIDDPTIDPPQLRQTDDCIEWLNPLTQEWECVLPLETPTQPVCPDCGEILEECEECEEMACSKCGNKNQVVFCDGKLQYVNADGTLTPVPTNSVTSPEPTPPVDEIPVSDNACWKSWGLWSAFERMMDALTETGEDLGAGEAVNWYYDLQQNHKEIDWDNDSLYKAIYAKLTGDNAAIKAQWDAEKSAFRDNLICAVSYRLSKISTLSNEDILAFKDVARDTSEDSDLNDYIREFVEAPELKYWRAAAASGVLDATGECNCGSGGIAIPDIPDGASIVESSIVRMVTHLAPGDLSLSAIKGSDPDGTKTGSKWSGERFYDGENTLYKIGILLEMKPAAFIINSCAFRIETQSGGGYVAATLWQWNGDDPSDDFEEQGRTPDDESTSPVPSGGVGYSSGAMGGTFKYLLIGAGIVYNGNVTKIARISGIVLTVTIDGEIFNWALPDIPLLPSE